MKKKKSHRKIKKHIFVFTNWFEKCTRDRFIRRFSESQEMDGRNSLKGRRNSHTDLYHNAPIGSHLYEMNIRGLCKTSARLWKIFEIKT